MIIKLEEKDNLENISVDDRTRLELIARKSGVRMWSGYISLAGCLLLKIRS
jgi:hypothetical protein